MTHIIKSEDDITKIRECIALFKKEGLNGDSLNIVANRLMPRDYHGLLVDYKIKDQGFRAAEFIPTYCRIDFSIQKCKQWLDTNVDSLAEYYHISDKETFRSYLAVYLLMHEIEHSYEYLIGRGAIQFPCLIVRDGYRALNDLLTKPNTVFPHPIRETRRAISLFQYYRNQNFYILERNAQLEAYGGMHIVALNEGHQEMINSFNDMTKAYISLGYEKDNKGCMYHTFKDLIMLDYYNKMNRNENIPSDMALRYGLEVSEEARQEFLAKIKRRTK